VKAFFKSLFGASAKEISGLSLLLTILILSWAIPKLYNKFVPVNTDYQIKDKEVLDSIILLIDQEKAIQEPTKDHKQFSFDPNLASFNDLVSLGFHKPIAGRIIKYREKGGRFRIKNDLYKIYDIDSILVDELIDFISLPVVKAAIKIAQPPEKSPFDEKQVISKMKVVDLPLFDINHADTSVLQTINGIGTVLSKRIVEFRMKLGGYVNIEQLYYIYNLDSAVVEKLISQSFVMTNFEPIPLFINKLNTDSLAHHPYISWQQAKLIIAYRNQHGDFLSAEELLKVYSLEEKDVQKLLPYISWKSTN